MAKCNCNISPKLVVHLEPVKGGISYDRYYRVSTETYEIVGNSLLDREIMSDDLIISYTTWCKLGNIVFWDRQRRKDWYPAIPPCDR